MTDMLASVFTWRSGCVAFVFGSAINSPTLWADVVLESRGENGWNITTLLAFLT